ncbi:PAS domain-containing protein [Nitrincola schmidtii]|uniref:PAS domain-containing protein n=1 Tax=Nitrincola schmidtii TaxID=1730894 RepID=UPI00124C669F|nr:PAS domain-containing protein [Nitrincola schmidtii]
MIDKRFPMSLFELAVEQTYDSILITTAELDLPGPQIIYVNDAFCRKTGYSREELIGKTPRILQGEMTNRSLLDELRETLASGQRFEGSTINYRKNGQPYVVRWSISPLMNEKGEIVNFVSVQRDITHQVELENFNQRLLESLAEGVFCIDNQGI